MNIQEKIYQELNQNAKIQSMKELIYALHINNLSSVKSFILNKTKREIHHQDSYTDYFHVTDKNDKHKRCISIINEVSERNFYKIIIGEFKQYKKILFKELRFEIINNEIELNKAVITQNIKTLSGDIFANITIYNDKIQRDSFLKALVILNGNIRYSIVFSIYPNLDIEINKSEPELLKNKYQMMQFHEALYTLKNISDKNTKEEFLNFLIYQKPFSEHSKDLFSLVHDITDINNLFHFCSFKDIEKNTMHTKSKITLN